MNFTDIPGVLLDALLDTLKLLPFLFLTYLLMEFLEHRAGEKVQNAIRRAGVAGPLAGGMLGLVPQCGFSAAAAGLYAGRVISLGTLFAVFLATSDEMLPIFIGENVPARVIFTVLGVKLFVALLAGFTVDLVFRRKKEPEQIVDLCEAEHCHCENGILRSALHHTWHISLFILLVNLVLGAALFFVGEERIGAAFSAIPVLGVVFSALFGLIPNCAASVAVAELYVAGIIPAGAMLAGLLPASGAGILVLCRTNHHKKENAVILGVLALVGIAVGLLLDLTGLSALMGL